LRKDNIVEVIGLKDLPIIAEGDDLATLVCNAAKKQGTPILDGDVIVISHVVASRAEGNTINLDDASSRRSRSSAVKKNRPHGGWKADHGVLARFRLCQLRR